MDTGIVWGSSNTAASGLYLPLAGGTMTGPITLSGNAVNPLEPVTFQQFQLAALGVTPFGAVHAATTSADGNKALTGAVTADGQVVPNTDLVLLQYQTDAKENGPWVVNTGGAWSRPTNFVNGTDSTGGIISVVNGPTYGGQIRIQVSDPGIVGTDDLDFQFFSNNTVFADGTTIVDNASVFSIANDGILDIHVNTAAAIQGTKIYPDFGSQFVQSTDGAQFKNLYINGNSGDGFIHLSGQGATPSNPGVGAFRIYDTTAGILGLFSGSGAGGAALFDVTAMTTNKTFTFPDLAGIVALVPTAGFVTSNGNKLSSQAAIDLSTDVTGILDIPNGGTNSSSFVQGSVIFASATKLTENNNEFFWDNTNLRLGIQAGGAPTTALQVGSADASKYLQLDPDAGLIVSGAASNVTRIVAESTFGSGVPAEIAIAARPASAMGGFEALGWLSFFGRDNAGNQRRGAYIRGITSGAWTSTSLPTHMDFFTVPSGSDTEVQRMRLHSSGEFYTGSTGLITTTGTLSVGPLTTAKVGVYVRANAGQTADLLQIQNSSAVTIMNVEADGDLNARSLIATGTAGSGFLQLTNQFLPTTAAASAIKVFSNAGNFAVKTSSPIYTFDHSLLSTNRTFQFIDADYIFANVPAAGIVKSSGAILTSVSAIDVATEVSGILPMANGGSGVASLTSGPVFSNGTILTTKEQQSLQVTATQTNNTVTPTNITQLTSSTLGGGKSYRVRGVIVFQSTATTTGIGLRIAPVTATMSLVYAAFKVKQAANGTAQNFQYEQLTTATNVTSTSNAAANTDSIATFEGTFTLTVGGTVSLQFRSEIAASAVSIRAGSYMVIEEI